MTNMSRLKSHRLPNPKGCKIVIHIWNILWSGRTRRSGGHQDESILAEEDEYLVAESFAIYNMNILHQYIV